MHTPRLLLALLFGACLALNSHASETLTRNASGYGGTPQQAVANALVEAARQGLGVVVTLDPAFRTQVREWVVKQGVATGRWYSEPETQLPTLASVAGYRVLATRQISEGLWQADVEAQLLDYAPVGPDRRHLPSVAVGSFRTAQPDFDLGGTLPAPEVSARLRNALVNSLSQSGRLRVLDRDFSADLDQELNVSAGSLLPAAQLQLGREMGADLMLVGEIRDFQLGRPQRRYYGAAFNDLEPVVRIHYRLIETATGEIVRADTFVYRETPADLRRRLRDADIDPERERDRISELLFPDVAADLTSTVTDTLYPIRVLASDHGSYYLSQGSGRLVAGRLLSVHDTLRELEDPDTGQRIRLESPPLATLRVTRVLDDHAVAELVEGNAAAITADALLRPTRVAATTPSGRPMTPGSSAAPIQWD
ncbi:CsgG/HfaB family protein [Isoalcanivorax indicus]|uniref:CsgG/HfaB family protein n=1 Tax=Isoalcanivorax indicus TaxID=2202653 RepID=UPI000DB9A33A|nr:CsgG/HfaB family protein [Isoalcanivorax indicus]